MHVRNQIILSYGCEEAQERIPDESEVLVIASQQALGTATTYGQLIPISTASPRNEGIPSCYLNGGSVERTKLLSNRATS